MKDEGENPLLAAADVDAAHRKLSAMLEGVVERRKAAESTAALDDETLSQALALRMIEDHLRNMLDDREFLALFDLNGGDVPEA